VVLVFARAPLAGRAKTRIARRIGTSAAARLQERLVRAALATARAARCGPVELHVTRRHAWFASLAVKTKLQRGAELGERMQRALRAALQRHPRVVLIGADCPALRGADIARAVRWLQGGADIVLAPAEDGGYALIAARRLHPALFSAIAWGGASVLEHTIENAARGALRLRLLRTVWDVDRPQDLERLGPLALARGSALRKLTRRASGERARARDTLRAPQEEV
jgi:rSAM/selenodomain-associated transferase 1